MAEKLLKETKDTQTKRKKTKKVAEEDDIYKIDLTLESPENEDEQTKKKEDTPKQSKKNNVGFVERKQNKDYNIVYRNKPNKPMTVSELFGLAPKKEEKRL